MNNNTWTQFIGLLIMITISVGGTILHITTYYMAFKYLMGTL